MKAVLGVILVALALMILPSCSYACVGARPLAMGGAFSGLADDANATYWNPAGLVNLHTTETATMHTITNRDKINYQDYAAVAFPLGLTSAIGVSWISHNLALGQADVYPENPAESPFAIKNGVVFDEQDWYWISIAQKLSDKSSIGLNVRSMQSSYSDLNSDIAIDIGLLSALNDNVTFGLLVQNANEPVLKYDNDLPVRLWTQNWRPGLSIRPNDRSVISFELYDATDDASMRSLRVGYETHLSKSLAFRCGYYGLGAEDNNALTIGLGVINRNVDFNASSLDITAMIGDVEAVFGSINISF
jgi:hypothetical protein